MPRQVDTWPANGRLTVSLERDLEAPLMAERRPKEQLSKLVNRMLRRGLQLSWRQGGEVPRP